MEFDQKKHFQSDSSVFPLGHSHLSLWGEWFRPSIPHGEDTLEREKSQWNILTLITFQWNVISLKVCQRLRSVESGSRSLPQGLSHPTALSQALAAGAPRDSTTRLHCSARAQLCVLECPLGFGKCSECQINLGEVLDLGTRAHKYACYLWITVMRYKETIWFFSSWWPIALRAYICAE